jgi:CRP-like cAMP-binding protein
LTDSPNRPGGTGASQNPPVGLGSIAAARGAETVNLALGDRLEQPGSPVLQCYIPIDALIGLFAWGPTGRSLQVGVIGPGNSTGLSVVLDFDAALHEARVLVPGQALRLTVKMFSDLVSGERMLFRSAAKATILGIGEAATLAIYADIQQRVAHLLLQMCQALDVDALHTSHERLASALGVRRPSVTLSIARLEQKGLVKAGRERLTVVDREALDAYVRGLSRTT